MQNATVLTTLNIKLLYTSLIAKDCKICGEKKKKKASLVAVAERAEWISDILQWHCSLQGHPAGHHLSTLKALAESLQWSSTNLDSLSICDPLPLHLGCTEHTHCPHSSHSSFGWRSAGETIMFSKLSPSFPASGCSSKCLCLEQRSSLSCESECTVNFLWLLLY